MLITTDTDNNFLTINGRGNDNSGCVTCKNISTVDYFLPSPSLVSKIGSLYVHEFCELFSDTHSPMSLKVNVGKFNIYYDSSGNNMDKIKLWDAEKSNHFSVILMLMILQTCVRAKGT